MSARLTLAVLGGALLFAPAVSVAAGEPSGESAVAVLLKVGGSQTIPVSDVSRVAVSNPDVADIRVDEGKRVHVTGRAPGNTTVLVWKQNGQKRVWSVTVTP